MAVGVRECPLPTREKTAPNVGFLTVSQGHFNFGAFSIKITDYQNARSTERSVAHRTFGHCDFCDFSEDEAKLKLLYKTTGETAFRVALLRNNRRHPCTSTDFFPAQTRMSKALSRPRFGPMVFDILAEKSENFDRTFGHRFGPSLAVT